MEDNKSRFHAVTSNYTRGLGFTSSLWLIQTELKRDQDRKGWLTVYYTEHFTLQLMWELKWDRKFNEWLQPFCTLPGELMSELTVISMSDPGPV